MLDEAHAFWLRRPGRGEIRSVALPEPGSGDVAVRTLRTGTSRGTETLAFRGGVSPSQYVAMRAPFQEGDFPGPVKYGYLNVGAVEQGPPELRGRTVVTGESRFDELPGVMARLAAGSLPALCHTSTYDGA